MRFHLVATCDFLARIAKPEGETSFCLSRLVLLQSLSARLAFELPAGASLLSLDRKCLVFRFHCQLYLLWWILDHSELSSNNRSGSKFFHLCFDLHRHMEHSHVDSPWLLSMSTERQRWLTTLPHQRRSVSMTCFKVSECSLRFCASNRFFVLSIFCNFLLLILFRYACNNIFNV